MDNVTTAALIQKVAADTERLIRSARDEYTDGLISDKITDLANFLTPSVPSDRPEALRKGALTNDVEVWFEVAVNQMLKEDIERIVRGRVGMKLK
ncbi:hypothetical protein HK104_000857 [Borealophlyctis nickersoniae]|nr:hypothetical protein HK104_000857 [Borealophlyctis nickersoniae]